MKRNITSKMNNNNNSDPNNRKSKWTEKKEEDNNYIYINDEMDGQGQKNTNIKENV